MRYHNVHIEQILALYIVGRSDNNELNKTWVRTGMSDIMIFYKISRYFDILIYIKKS